MPNQPPSDRTRAKGGPPSPEFWILTSGFSPIMRNEPNLPPCRPSQDQKTRNEPNFRCSEQILTTNDWRLKTAFNETNPISSPPRAYCLLPHAQKCETNPISAPNQPAHHPYMRNEPNLHRDGLVEDQKMRNKPNSRIPSAPPAHIYAKRTQSPHRLPRPAQNRRLHFFPL